MPSVKRRTDKRKAQPVNMRVEQRERTRAAITDSAIQVFAEVGFDAAQTREIAARAQVMHGLVHYYFGSKIKLWKACMEHLFERAYSEGGHDPVNISPGKELIFMRKLIRNYVEFAAQYPEWARILNDEARRPGPRLAWIVERYLEKNVVWLHELFRRLQKQGHLPAFASPTTLHYIFWGMVNTLFTMAPEVKCKLGIDPIGNRALIEEQIRTIEALFLRGAD